MARLYKTFDLNTNTCLITGFSPTFSLCPDQLMMNLSLIIQLTAMNVILTHYRHHNRYLLCILHSYSSVNHLSPYLFSGTDTKCYEIRTRADMLDSRALTNQRARTFVPLVTLGPCTCFLLFKVRRSCLRFIVMSYHAYPTLHLILSFKKYPLHTKRSILLLKATSCRWVCQ